MLSAQQEATTTIFKVFGMTRPGIELVTSRTQIGRSNHCATRWWYVAYVNVVIYTVQ